MGTSALIEDAIRHGEGLLAKDGPLVVETGKHTGRSAKDKFIVQDAETADTIWWGKTNVPMTPDHFAALKADFFAHLAARPRLLRSAVRGRSAGTARCSRLQDASSPPPTPYHARPELPDGISRLPIRATGTARRTETVVAVNFTRSSS